MKPIEMTDVYSAPEAVDKRFIELEKKIEANNYTYNGNKYKELDKLEAAYEMNKVNRERK